MIMAPLRLTLTSRAGRPRYSPSCHHCNQSGVSDAEKRGSRRFPPGTAGDTWFTRGGTGPTSLQTLALAIGLEFPTLATAKRASFAARTQNPTVEVPETPGFF